MCFLWIFGEYALENMDSTVINGLRSKYVSFFGRDFAAQDCVWINFSKEFHSGLADKEVYERGVIGGVTNAGSLPVGQRSVNDRGKDAVAAHIPVKRLREGDLFIVQFEGMTSWVTVDKKSCWEPSK